MSTPIYQPRFESTFVGREKDLQSLGAKTIEGMATFLVGEAGVGKSRLLDAFLSTRASAGVFLDAAPYGSMEDAIGGWSVQCGASAESVHAIGSALARKRLAWIAIDNLEHLQDELTDVVRVFRNYCPSVVWYFSTQQLPGSRWIAENDRVLQIDPLNQVDSEQLLVERLQSVSIANEQAKEALAVAEGNAFVLELEAARLLSIATDQQSSSTDTLGPAIAGAETIHALGSALTDRLLNTLLNLEDEELGCLDLLLDFPVGLTREVLEPSLMQPRHTLRLLRASSLVQIDARQCIRLPFVVAKTLREHRDALISPRARSLREQSFERLLGWSREHCIIHRRLMALPDAFEHDRRIFEVFETHQAILRHSLQQRREDWAQSAYWILTALAFSSWRKIPLGSLQVSANALIDICDEVPELRNIRLATQGVFGRIGSDLNLLRLDVKAALAQIDKTQPLSNEAEYHLAQLLSYQGQTTANADSLQEASELLREYANTQNDPIARYIAHCINIHRRGLLGETLVESDRASFDELARGTGFDPDEILSHQAYLCDVFGLEGDHLGKLAIAKRVVEMADAVHAHRISASMRVRVLRTEITLFGRILSFSESERNRLLDDLALLDLGWFSALTRTCLGVHASIHGMTDEAASFFDEAIRETERLQMQALRFRVEVLSALARPHGVMPEPSFALTDPHHLFWAEIASAIHEDDSREERKGKLQILLEATALSDSYIDLLGAIFFDVKNADRVVNPQPASMLVLSPDASRFRLGGSVKEITGLRRQFLLELLPTLGNGGSNLDWKELALRLWPDAQNESEETLRNRFNVQLHKMRKRGFADAIEYSPLGYRLNPNYLCLGDPS